MNISFRLEKSKILFIKSCDLLFELLASPSPIFLSSALPELKTILGLIFEKVSKMDVFNENFSFFSHHKRVRLCRAVGMGPLCGKLFNPIPIMGGGAYYTQHISLSPPQFTTFRWSCYNRKRSSNFMSHRATDC